MSIPRRTRKHKLSGNRQHVVTRAINIIGEMLLMWRTIKLTILATFIASMMVTVAMAGKTKYSGSGRKPPRKLDKRQVTQIKAMLVLIPEQYDPYEIVAIGMVESNLTINAVSDTGDYGLMQVNCRIHKKQLRAIYGFKNCKKDMLIMTKSLIASLYVIDDFRKNHRRCRGTKVYACYNGGQGWRTRQRKCLKKCTTKPECLRCTRVSTYSKNVKRNILFLRNNYSYLFKNRPPLVDGRASIRKENE